jgi:hypothetical protein
MDAKRAAAAAAMALGMSLAWAGGAEVVLQLRFPLERAAYQTNEDIPLLLLRRAPGPIPAGDLRLALAGDDGSRLAFAFPLPAADAADTTVLHLNGWLLRPGRYALEASAHGAAASAAFDVYSHVRRSSFTLVNWGRAKKKDEQIVQGADSLGYNLFFGHYGSDDEANFIRAGVDFMSCCTMGGGHQIDLRSECDWSDPYAIRGGGTAKVVRRALIDRTRPNVTGVHFYDEPGLTWAKHPATGEMTAHMIPPQVRSYRSAFGREPLSYHEVDPANPDHVARWKHWAMWKLGFMDAAWKDAQFGVSHVQPDYLSVTQSQYGFSAFTDGYYFNVARCMPVVSGHGGYDDYGPDYFNPSYFLETARARDFARPCWYLPTWYGSTPPERFRLEQYLSFITNIQGMVTPPDMDPFLPWKTPAAEAILETNHLMAALGPVFTTMPPTRPSVAVLYSLSHLLEKQARDRKVMYAHDDDHGRNLPFTYLAGKLLQHQFLTVVDEDVTDGTLAAHHRAVVLTSIDFLDPEVIKGLEAFAAQGGLVLLTGDCEVKIAGAVNLGVTPKLPDAEQVEQLRKEKKSKEIEPLVTLGKQLQGAMPLAKAIRERLEAAKIRPVFECDEPGIVAARQAAGDIEYLFAVNAACDLDGPRNNTRAAATTITLTEGGAVYDAVRGGPVPEFKDGPKGTFRFGAGQMRAFARTARPIGGVKAAKPVVHRDYTKTHEPLAVEIGATLLDASGGVLSGSAPLRVRVTDPLGGCRYDLYRATRLGSFSMTLPLALNDPPGEWTVTVTDLLAGTEGASTFRLDGPARAGAVAGMGRRAIHFGRDRENAFRFFRIHQDVTLVTGSGAFNRPAAERLAEILKPWDVRCTLVSAADVNKRREVPPEGMPTWAGVDFGRLDPAKYGPGHAGFALQGPAVLIGSPEDHPLIKFLQDRRYLPFKAGKDVLPGRGRGYIAWQRDGIGYGQESITLIAHDEAGMAEAAGTLYEAMAGLEPLTPYAPPLDGAVTPATAKPSVPEIPLAWQAVLPDRAANLAVEGDRLVATTLDGSRIGIAADGKPGPAAEAAAAFPRMAEVKAADLPGPAPEGRIPKFVARDGSAAAVAYWGGLLQVYGEGGELKGARKLPQDVAGLAWFGGRVVVAALADGRVVALVPR